MRHAVAQQPPLDDFVSETHVGCSRFRGKKINVKLATTRDGIKEANGHFHHRWRTPLDHIPEAYSPIVDRSKSQRMARYPEMNRVVDACAESRDCRNSFRAHGRRCANWSAGCMPYEEFRADPAQRQKQHRCRSAPERSAEIERVFYQLSESQPHSLSCRFPFR